MRLVYSSNQARLHTTAKLVLLLPLLCECRIRILKTWNTAASDGQPAVLAARTAGRFGDCVWVKARGRGDEVYTLDNTRSGDNVQVSF